MPSRRSAPRPPATVNRSTRGGGWWRRTRLLARSPRLRALEVKYAVGRRLRTRATADLAGPGRRLRPHPAEAARPGARHGSASWRSYLPQFHPVPENDEWWGRGFTDWRNVVPARPLFPGHYQPHLPADLGFYDLRVPEVRVAQAELARATACPPSATTTTGSRAGACWSDPSTRCWRRATRLPVLPVLGERAVDARLGWSRLVGARRPDVLHGRRSRAPRCWLTGAFVDERYLRVDGRPVFLVYRAAALPDARRTTDILRAEARRAGVGELLLCRVESFRGEHGDPGALGFDAAVEFQPDWVGLGRSRRRSYAWRAAARAGLAPRVLAAPGVRLRDGGRDDVEAAPAVVPPLPGPDALVGQHPAAPARRRDPHRFHARALPTLVGDVPRPGGG